MEVIGRGALQHLEKIMHSHMTPILCPPTLLLSLDHVQQVSVCLSMPSGSLGKPQFV